MKAPKDVREPLRDAYSAVLRSWAFDRGGYEGTCDDGSAEIGALPMPRKRLLRYV